MSEEELNFTVTRLEEKSRELDRQIERIQGQQVDITRDFAILSHEIADFGSQGTAHTDATTRSRLTRLIA